MHGQALRPSFVEQRHKIPAPGPEVDVAAGHPTVGEPFDVNRLLLGRERDAQHCEE